MADEPRDPPGARDLLLALAAYSAWYALFFSPAFLHGIFGPGETLFEVASSLLAPREPWSGAMFGGFPSCANPVEFYSYPVQLLWRASGARVDVFFLSAYVLASAFTYLLALDLTRNRAAAAFAGLAYGSGGYFMMRAGHQLMIHGSAWLPLVLFTGRRVLDEPGPRTGAGLAAAVGVMLGAIAPQTAFYSFLVAGAYGLARVAVEPRDRAARLAWGAGSILLGAALAGAALLPFVELAPHTNRGSIPFEMFVSFSLPLVQLPMLVFPFCFGGAASGPYMQAYIGKWNLVECTGYVGALPLGLALGLFCLPGGRAAGRRFEVGFWTLVAGVSLLLATSGETPLGKLVFLVPGLNLFRSQGRFLFLWSLAMALLGALGIQALAELADGEREGVARRLPRLFLGLVGLALLPLLAGGRYIAARAADRGGAWSPLPFVNPALGIPLLLALCGAGLLRAYAARPGRARAWALVGWLGLELASFGQFCAWRTSTFSPADLEPPPALAGLMAEVRDRHERILTESSRMSARETVVPSLNRLWGVSNVGGYCALVLRRFAELASMDSIGGVEIGSLADAHRAFDLLGVRWLLLYPPEADDAPSFQRHGYGWPWQVLELELDSAQPTWSVDLPGLPGRSLAVVSQLIPGPGALAPGTPVAELAIGSGSALRPVGTLRYGRETAARSPLPDEPASLPEVFGDDIVRDDEGRAIRSRRFFTAFPLEPPGPVDRITVRYTGPAGARLKLFWLNLGLGEGRPSRGIGLGHQMTGQLRAGSRWVPRGLHGAVEVYENTRVLPRAWLATEELVLGPTETLAAVRTGLLPGGGPFDPARVALVPAASGPALVPGAGPGRVEVLAFEAYPRRLRVEAPGGGVLVLSEIDYPGWEARVDGAPAPLHRVDHVLLGLRLAPGTHQVELARVASPGLRLGQLVSLLAGLVWLGLATRPRRAA